MKRFPKPSILFLCFSFFLSYAQAQFNETLFYDTVSKVSNDGYISSGFIDNGFLYLSGSSFSQEKPVPTVTKLDTAGNVIWTAIDNYRLFPNYRGFINNRAICTNTIKSGSRLFTIVQSRSEP